MTHLGDMDQDKVRRDFARAVNMDAAEIEAWLDTAESRREVVEAAN